MEILKKLFGSLVRVKLLRLFVFNPERFYDLSEAASRTKSDLGAVRKEIANLVHTSLIKPGVYSKIISRGNGVDERTIKHKKVKGYKLNKNFKHLRSLRTLLLEIVPFTQSDISKRLAKSGKIKALITAGVFAHDDDGRLDLLVVGDKLKPNVISREIKTIESELGKELRYVVLDTNEFKYRLSIYDKLIRDTFDYPHQIVTDLLGIHYDL